jgi:hypothetical protein
MRKSRIRANNEGYWGYNNMVLQLKDCIDCLKAVYSHLEFVFLFGHSSGHSKRDEVAWMQAT